MKAKVLLAAAGIAMGIGCGAAAPALQLSFPVDCRVGQSCEIQNYMDRDAAKGAAKDYRGGSLSYDDHDGTDIRVRSLADSARGVRVLAAADGKVLRVRDGVADVSVRTEGRAEAIASRKCGNGVVIEHGGDYTTQYCHMARGSLTVKPGDVVKAGQPIGLIGLSGQTEYPHLHFVVRQGSAIIDPFAPAEGRSLWKTPPAYRARAVLNTGFRTEPVTMEQVEAGGEQPITAAAPLLVAYARAIGLKAGDEQELTLTAPDGTVLATQRLQPLASNKAHAHMFVGKRRPAAGWPAGSYTARFRVWGGGKVVLEQAFRTTL